MQTFGFSRIQTYAGIETTIEYHIFHKIKKFNEGLFTGRNYSFLISQQQINVSRTKHILIRKLIETKPLQAEIYCDRWRYQQYPRLNFNKSVIK